MADESGETESTSSSNRYRTQRRGGKGLRDIKTTDRNGPVIAVVGVSNDDEVLMMTARGKIQRTAVAEISVIGRNTQGVRIMSLDAGDALAAVVRVPRDATAPLSESEPAVPGRTWHFAARRTGDRCLRPSSGRSRRRRTRSGGTAIGVERGRPARAERPESGEVDSAAR